MGKIRARREKGGELSSGKVVQVSARTNAVRVTRENDSSGIGRRGDRLLKTRGNDLGHRGGRVQHSRRDNIYLHELPRRKELRRRDVGQRGARCIGRVARRDLKEPDTASGLKIQAETVLINLSEEGSMWVIEVSMEQRRNERAWETGDPRENPPTNGLVRHDSRIDPAGDSTRIALVGGEQANRSATAGSRVRNIVRKSRDFSLYDAENSAALNVRDIGRAVSPPDKGCIKSGNGGQGGRGNRWRCGGGGMIEMSYGGWGEVDVIPYVGECVCSGAARPIYALRQPVQFTTLNNNCDASLARRFVKEENGARDRSLILGRRCDNTPTVLKSGRTPRSCNVTDDFQVAVPGIEPGNHLPAWRVTQQQKRSEVFYCFIGHPDRRQVASASTRNTAPRSSIARDNTGDSSLPPRTKITTLLRATPNEIGIRFPYRLLKVLPAVRYRPTTSGPKYRRSQEFAAVLKIYFKISMINFNGTGFPARTLK
ncbi:hypothetical protein PR048_000801 [Dryococelus australis]|uniref:Uncharacterized protein n=1 Tax=Dryococelus australis TaxID=614101 RepID=A0ABQ9IFM3_9NEOP|nr:hypothetical protein PR048_000801 [Dryococelus australis]